MNDSSPDDIACDVVDVSAGDQDAPPKRKVYIRNYRILLQAAMEDLKHELEENWGCKPTQGSSITEVEALNAAHHEIVLSGPPPIHAEQILVNREVEQRPRPAKERSKRAEREQVKRDKVRKLLEELSRYVPWPTPGKHGPRHHQIVQNALEILRGLPTRGLANDT